MKQMQIQRLPGASHFLVTGSLALDIKAKCPWISQAKCNCPWCSSQRQCQAVPSEPCDISQSDTSQCSAPASLSTDLLSTAANEVVFKYFTFSCPAFNTSQTHRSSWEPNECVQIGSTCNSDNKNQQSQSDTGIASQQSPGSLSFQPKEFLFEDGTNRLIFSWEHPPVYSAELADLTAHPFWRLEKDLAIWLRVFYLFSKGVYYIQTSSSCLILSCVVISIFILHKDLVVVPSFTPFPPTFFFNSSLNITLHTTLIKM